MNDKNFEGRRRTRRWWALGVGLLLAGGWWAWQGGLAQTHDGDASAPASTSPPTPPAGRASTPGPASSTARPAALAALPAASAPASAALPARQRPGDLSPEQLAQIEKQWCSHGHAAYLQAMAAVKRAHPIDHSASEPDLAAIQAWGDARRRVNGQQARDAVRERLQRQWMQRLQQAGDPRSRAAAAYIGASSFFFAERRPYQQQLRSLAEAGRDPLIWHLWRKVRHGCFDDDPCGPAALKPWREIEPDNLLAWLPEFMSRQSIQAPDWAGIQATRHARSYQEDFIGLLLPLVEQETPGLALQEGLELISRLSHIWPTEGATLALLEACAEANQAPAAERQAACFHAAGLLWNAAQPQFFDRSFALRMATAAGQLEQSPWAERMAFIKTLSQDDGDKLLASRFRHSWDELGCDAQPRLRQQFKLIAQGGEWAAALGAERAARTP